MGQKTAITWTDSSFNPWWGCTKVSPACDHCYAESFAKRTGHQVWGAGAPRRYFGDKHWAQPLKWERDAIADRAPHRVFCASMADVFDNEVDQAHRERLWAVIRDTPHLTWQLLTKRIGNVRGMLPADWAAGYPNVWIGITVVSQAEHDRDVDKLREIPAGVRWLSIEPQIEDIRLDLAGIDWVVTGGESGGKARPYDLNWARSVIEQCHAQGAAPFVKQLGSNPFQYLGPCGVKRDRAGADPAEWPEDLRVREFPE
jgi:protein gp37